MKLINFKKIGIILGIIIVLNLFINFGIATFYDAPDYESFCPVEKRTQALNTKDSCEAQGGLWYENYDTGVRSVEPVPSEAVKPAGWCDPDYTCRTQYDDARNLYQRNVFIILVSFGVAFLIAGLAIVASSPLSIAFTYGGLLSVVVGTIRFWSEMDDYLRFIVLGVALAILIYVAVKKFKGE